MITRVYLNNFRCFVNSEIKLARINLLIGSNGSGKSSFLEAIHSVISLSVMSEAIEVAFPSSTLTRWYPTTDQRVELDIEFEDGTYNYVLEISHNPKLETVSLERELVKFDSRTIFLFEKGKVQLHNNQGVLGTQFPFRGSRSFLPQLEARPENTLLTRFLEFLRRVWLLKLNPSGLSSESRAESDTLDTDGSNFSSWYRHLSQEYPEELPTLFKRISDTLLGFRSLRMISTGGKGQKRELMAVFGVGNPETKYEIDFSEISDGERATIILCCILMDVQSSSRILLLDEPENFVGLQTIQPWLVDLADAMRDNSQLFLISHHPEVIDYLAADHSVLFERPKGGPTRVRFEPFNRDQGLRASELMTRGLLDG